MSKYYSLKVKEIRKETAQCVSVSFEVPEELKDTFKYIHGQHLSLRCMLNGQDIRRSYSICSSPFEDELRVAIKKVPNGVFSTYANEALAVGDTIEVFPPQGHFYTLPEPDSENIYVAFAAGSGITPVMSIIKTILQTEPKSTFILFYGNQATETIIFREQLEALKNRYIDRFAVHHILSQEKPESPLFTGRLNPEKCTQFARLFFTPREIQAFFLCGPESMIFDVKNCLEKLDVRPEQIHFELFTTPATKKAEPFDQSETNGKPTDKEALVKMILDGIQMEYQVPYAGKNILDAAIGAGADVPFACKGGVCCTCKAKLLDGKVNMDVNYGLEPDEIEAGYILTCQSHPRTEELLIDFDIR